MGEEQIVYNKPYMTDTWNEAQDEIQKHRWTDGCKLERVITGIILWSDLTHWQLVQFSHASAWPIYLFFSNLFKYVCQAANTQICHSIAFIPPVSILSLYTGYIFLKEILASKFHSQVPFEHYEP